MDVLAKRCGVAVLCAGVVLIFACQGPNTGSPSPSNGVSIPTSGLGQYYGCMQDAGFVLKTAEAVESGGVEAWDVPAGMDPAQQKAATDACDKYLPTLGPGLTNDEIRATYNKWVGEYQCLVDLGYHPDEPPSVETFIQTWRTTGPWAPMQGITTTLSREQVREAKQKCGLEMWIAVYPDLTDHP